MYMMFILTLLTIVQSFAISLGVGSSTLAIVNFFAAIADGSIDETERRMMGIVYVVLRIAMLLILLSTLSLIGLTYYTGGSAAISALTYAQLIALAVLFINAALMTAHLVPSTFGPAIQAGSWYTLGTLIPLASLGFTAFPLWQFLLAYVTWLVLAIGIVNGTMAILKARQDTPHTDASAA